VIIPQQNARDLDEMPDEVKQTVTFHPVQSMDEVLALALRETLPRPREAEEQPYGAVPTH
jgi:ATP-dependent Lon protease